MDGQKLFIDAVQRAKTTEVPEITELQKIGKFFLKSGAFLYTFLQIV